MKAALKVVDRVMQEVPAAAAAAVDGLDPEDVEEVVGLVVDAFIHAYSPEAKVVWSKMFLEMLKSAARHRKREIRRRVLEQLATAIEEWVEQGETAKELVRWRVKAVKMPCRGMLEAWVEQRGERPKIGCVRQFAWVLKDPPPQQPPLAHVQASSRPAAWRTRDLAE